MADDVQVVSQAIAADSITTVQVLGLTKGVEALRGLTFLLVGVFLAGVCQGRTITVDDNGPATQENSELGEQLGGLAHLVVLRSSVSLNIGK